MESESDITQSNESSIIENIEMWINKLSIISDFETIPSRISKYSSTNFTNSYSEIVDIKQYIVENPQELLNSATSLTFDRYIQNSDELLNLISENADKLDENTRKNFFDKIISLDQENDSIRLLSSIIYQDQTILTSLFTKYFTPDFSIFDNDADNNLLNFIRQHIVESIITSNDKSLVNESVQKISQNSYLLTEFLIRGLNLSVTYPQSINLQYIAPSISYFAQLFTSESNKKLSKFCLEQLLISSLISLMSSNTDGFTTYLNSESCIYTIVFIFSMDYFHETLSNLLIDKFKEVIPTHAANFIKIACNIMKNSNNFDMNFRFLACLNDLLNFSNLLMSMTHSLFANLLPIAEKCENSDYVSKLFDVLLNIIINDPKYVIYDYENSVFSKLFNKFISFDKMTYLLSRKKKVLEEHLYELENTSTIPLIFSFSSQNNKLNELFEILNQLADFSQDNINKLADSSLCSIIISLSKSNEEKIIFKGCEIQPIDQKIFIGTAIPYLIKITQTSCSLKIANEIIDLIIPEKIYKNYENISLKYIKSITDSCNIKMPIIHPLIPKNHVIYDGAMFNDLIDNGFSISFWIKMNESVVKRLKFIEFDLFKIFVGEEEFIRIGISESVIDVTISQVTKVSSFKINDKLDMNQWNLFTMALKKIDDKYKIQTYVNKLDAHSSAIPYEEFKNDSLIFQISNKENNLEQLSDYEKYHYIYLTNIMFHKSVFPQNEHKLSYKLGFSYQFCKIQPFFCFPEYKYHFNNLMNIKEIDNELLSPSFNSINYYIRNFPIEKLCSMLKTSAKTEEMYLIFIYFLQTIYNFKKENFELIVSLFEIFNFKIYESLFYLSSNFNDDEDRMTFFTDVLFNHDFFFKTNENEISKIFDFIIVRCFPQFFDIFTSKGFFRKIITIIRAFYIKNEEKEKNKINIENFLKKYNSFLLELYKETEDKEDGIISVLENAVSSKEQDLIIYFLKLSALLFDFAPKSQEYVKYLHSVNFTQYRQLLSPLLRSFFFISGQNFYIRSQVLAYQLPISFSCEMLIDDVSEFPVLYSLATLISLKGEKSVQKDVAKVLFKMTKKTEIVKMIKQLEFWQLWPCIFALMNEGILRNDMIYFISKILMYEFNISDFDQTLSLFELIGLRMNVDSLQCKIELIKTMFDEFFTKIIDENLMNDIWKRSILSMFFQWRKTSLSQKLRNEFSNSPFKESLLQFAADRESVIRTYHDLKDIKFDPTKYHISFVISPFTKMDLVAQSVIQQMEAAMKLQNHKSSKYTDFIQSAIKFVRNSDPCHFLHLNSMISKDLGKIKEELEMTTTPEMQMTAMRLNSFVNNLANQLHNVSKKMKMESDDLNQLLKMKDEKSLKFYKRINFINHQYDLVKPNFVLKNWISETFIANKMKRFKKYKKLKPIVRSTKTAIIQLKCKLYKEGDICIECDSLVFENEFIFENQKFKKTLSFDLIRHCFYSGRSGLSFIMKNGKMYLAVFDQEDVYDQMVSKLPFFIHNIGKQVTDEFGANLKSNLSFLTFYQFICGKTFASFKNYPQFPLSIYKDTIKDETVLSVINNYLQTDESQIKEENLIVSSSENKSISNEEEKENNSLVTSDKNEFVSSEEKEVISSNDNNELVSSEEEKQANEIPSEEKEKNELATSEVEEIKEVISSEEKETNEFIPLEEKSTNDLISTEERENNNLVYSEEKETKDVNSNEERENEQINEEVVEELAEKTDANLDGNLHEEEESRLRISIEDDSIPQFVIKPINSEINLLEKEESQKEFIIEEQNQKETKKFQGFDNYGVSCQEIFCCPESIDENFPSEVSHHLLNQLESADTVYKVVEWIENSLNRQIRVKTPDQTPKIMTEKKISFRKKSNRIYYNPFSKIFLLIIERKKILYSELDDKSKIQFSEVENLEIPDNSLITKYENTFIIINQESQTKTFLNDTNLSPSKTENLPSRILKIFNDGYYVEYTSDNKIIVYDGEQQKNTFYCYSGLISLSSSSLFDLLVFCLENGEILFYNVSDGLFINKYKNEKCCYQKVLCMPSIGDVVAYDNYKIDVFSVNGFFRRSINIPFNIKFWISLEIIGIDTIFVITDYWSLYIVELDCQKEPALIYESKLPIIGFEFDKVDRTFILIRPTDVILIPSDVNHILELRDP